MGTHLASNTDLNPTQTYSVIAFVQLEHWLLFQPLAFYLIRCYLIAKLYQFFWDSMDYSLLRLLCQVFQARMWVVCYFLLQDLPSPGIEAMSSALASGFFTAEQPGSPS